MGLAGIYPPVDEDRLPATRRGLNSDYDVGFVDLLGRLQAHRVERHQPARVRSIGVELLSGVSEARQELIYSRTRLFWSGSAQVGDGVQWWLDPDFILKGCIPLQNQDESQRPSDAVDPAPRTRARNCSPASLLNVIGNR